jgi:hypothetical protein
MKKRFQILRFSKNVCFRLWEFRSSHLCWTSFLSPFWDHRDSLHAIRSGRSRSRSGRARKGQAKDQACVEEVMSKSSKQKMVRVRKGKGQEKSRKVKKVRKARCQLRTRLNDLKGQGQEMSKTEKVQGNVRKVRTLMVREGRIC